MSNAYSLSRALNQSKQASREKIADAIMKSESAKKFIHHLGGQHPSTPFEDCFPNNQDMVWARFERKRNTPLPNRYRRLSLPNPAIYFYDKPKLPTRNELGYFVNAKMLDRSSALAELFPEYTHYFWYDLCGAPTKETLEELSDRILWLIDTDSDQPLNIPPKNAEFFITFYMNHRGRQSIRDIIGDGTLEEKAIKVRDYFNSDGAFDDNGVWQAGSYNTATCEVLDTYINGVAPMAVFRIFNQKPRRYLPSSETV